MENKVIIITGATSGIGYEMALEYSYLNCKIVITARSEEKLTELSKLIIANGSQALVVKGDVTIKENCENVIEKAISEFGKIDLLINNVGVTSRFLIEETNSDVLRQMMETNFWGAVYLTEKALPYLRASKGTVVAISSVIGKVPIPGRSGYSAAKHALESFFETLRMEMTNTGVTVLVIRPSYTNTPTRINAITSNGTLQNYTTLDESKLMPAKLAAHKIIVAIKKGKQGYTLGKKMEGSWLIILYGLFPKKISSLIYKKIRKESFSLFK